MPKLQWPEGLKRVQPLKRRAATLLGFGLEFAPFLILYPIALEWCYRTSGQPYAAAIAYEAAKNVTKFVHKGYAEAVFEDDEDEDDSFSPLGAPGKAPEVNQTQIVEAMHAAERKLPNPLLPEFWAVLFLAVVVIFNALVWFVQRWSIRVRARVQYSEAQALEPGTFAYITPHAHQGAAEIVPIQEKRLHGITSRFFMFQRQKYEVVEGGLLVRELEMPMGMTLRAYKEHKGLQEQQDINSATERYGLNSLHIEIPSFKDTFIKQILGPVPVFQFFCASLWLLDEYWNYALFNIFAIGMYECSTVFGKLKNMQALRGLKKSAIVLKVYRLGAWKDITTEQLLPGDIFSLPKVEGDVSVPCDAVLLRGSAVVNEASLTGESTPQMKEASSAEGSAGDEILDIEKNHRVHVLYSGTTLMQHNPPPKDGSGLTAPDNGCICYCLRTGFSSSEGKLVRMIEYSQEQVLTDAKEVLALLTLLLVFALAASGYVLQKGLKEGKRSQYELVLRCVLILTSVVPPELPMQTAVAVNTALFALFKAAVFCTEPFRIPFAGKVEYALFDKTGTLTTDKLVCVGTWSGGQNVETKPIAQVEREAAVVLSTCQALVKVGEKVVGDPIETAAIGAIGWTFDPTKQIAEPGEKSVVAKPGEIQATVLHRYHFASKLQRMSVVASIKERGAHKTMALVKGSPEIVSTLLKKTPENYHEAYQAMAERGMRVLALASRMIEGDEEVAVKDKSRKGQGIAREEVEKDLTFVGFVAFTCLVRRDTAEVVKELQHSSHYVAMATGDAALTGIFVAREVGICGTDPSKSLLLEKSSNGALEWKPVKRGIAMEPKPYSAKGIALLDKEGFDLCMTGPSLQAAAAEDADVWNYVKYIKIFARMAPDDKEAVLRALKEQGHHTLMCGDGANDVGALKQAHVGLALLSGFGGANTAKEGEKTTNQESADEKKARQEEEKKKMMEKQKIMQAEVKKDQEELKKFQMDRYQQILNDMTNRNESWAGFKAIRQAMSETNAEMTRRQKERQARLGGSNAFTAHAAMLAGDEMETGEVPMVKLGDASVAAPFTSKLPSIRSTMDIIRQGRCTLVSTIQMQQVLALNCLISAYSLSALYLDGVRMGENQMIATGLLLSVASLAFSYARPVQKLSPCRPITTIFHPAIWVSIMGQLLIHLGSMMYAIALTRAAVSEEEAAVLDGAIPEPEETPPPSPDGESITIPFKPSLLNTVVFLIETAQQVSVMAVNYKGRPFMLAATENAPMGYSLLAVCIGVFVCAFEVLPWLNDLLKLVPMPSDEFRTKVLVSLGASVFGSLLWDRVCVAIFAPKLLWVGYVDAWQAAPPWKDQLKTLNKMGYIAIVLAVYYRSEFNLIVLFGGWWGWRKLYGEQPPATPPTQQQGAQPSAAQPSAAQPQAVQPAGAEAKGGKKSKKA